MLGFHPLSTQPISALTPVVSGNTIIDLTTASFLFTAQPVTIITDKLIELTTASFVFTARATQNLVRIQLGVATFSFTALMVDIIAFMAPVLGKFVGMLVNLGKLLRK